jgi:hypothetical protein
VANLRFTGDHLDKPLQVTKLTVEPAPGEPYMLNASATIPAGAATALSMTARLSLAGYQVSVHGPATLSRLRELSQVSGVPHAFVLDNLDGQPAILDLNANGPWLPVLVSPVQDSIAVNQAPAPVLVSGSSDHVSGTVSLRAATWKPGFLAIPVDLATATLHLDDSGGRWDLVNFTYGPVRGTATLEVPARCDKPDDCIPQFTVQFGTLDAASLQAALLGAQQSGTMISSLLARLRPSSAPNWPELEGSVRADEFTLGPLTLTGANASVHVQSDSIEITSVDAGVLGGCIHASGDLTPGAKPNYELNGRFEQLNAADLGHLLGMTWSGDPIEGTGKIELVGFTDKELAASAKGALHFDWRHGSITDSADLDLPPALARFDRWTADAEIANGAITLKQNQVQHGDRKLSVEGAAFFGNPPRVSFGEPSDSRAQR